MFQSTVNDTLRPRGTRSSVGLGERKISNATRPPSVTLVVSVRSWMLNAVTTDLFVNAAALLPATSRTGFVPGTV